MAAASIAITHALRTVRANIGPGAFAPLTPQDSAAWEAFVCSAELYRRGDQAGRDAGLRALAATLAGAQRTAAVQRVFLYALIVTLDHEPAERVMTVLWPQLDGVPVVEVLPAIAAAAFGGAAG
jgi:hypothetical protein